MILTLCRHSVDFLVGAYLRLGGGIAQMSDLLRPVVGGGSLPPVWILFLLPPIWGLSGYPRGRLDLLGRGGG